MKIGVQFSSFGNGVTGYWRENDMYTATLTIDNLLPSTDVPLLTEMTAREFIEAAFVLLQTDANSDPFKFTIAYYGYDHYQGVTTYLGYFIVSIGNSTTTYANDAANYWELFVNKELSEDGMDSVLIEPGDQVELKWITSGAGEEHPATNVRKIQARRSTKSSPAESDSAAS